MLPAELVVVFLASLAGSYHCLGMCGGFACALAPDPRSKTRTIIRHLVYNSGRVVTYVFLGAVLGTLGMKLTADDSLLDVFYLQKVLSVLAGCLMILMASKFLRMPGSRSPATADSAAVPTFQIPVKALFDTQGKAAPLALGVLNGFLPCPLVYAFLALAVSGADTLVGMILMAVFGLGTFPAMLAAGSLGLRERLARKPQLVKVAGVLILIFGLLTIARAFLSPAGQHWHAAGV